MSNQPGAVLAAYTIKNPRVAHNAYLEALADLGIPGLVTLVAGGDRRQSGPGSARPGSSSESATAGWKRSRAPSSSQRIAVLTADLFVSSEYAKYLWLLVAMCPVLLGLARRTRAQVASP